MSSRDALAATPTILICIRNSIEGPPSCELGMESSYKLVLTMFIIIIFLSECRLRRLFSTIFKQIRTQRRAAPGCFGFPGAKGCCGASSHGFRENFNLAVVSGETQTKKKERRIVVASPSRSIINDQVEAMREAGISVIALPCRGTMR